MRLATPTLDLPSEIAEAIAEAATRQGRSREELTVAALQRLFLPAEESVSSLAEDPGGRQSVDAFTNFASNWRSSLDFI